MKAVSCRFPVLILLCPYASGLILGPAALAFWLVLALRSSREIRGRARGTAGRPPTGPARISSRTAAQSFAAVLAAAAGMILQPERAFDLQEPRIVRFSGTVLDGPWPSRLVPGTSTLAVIPDCRGAARARAMPAAVDGVRLRNVKPGVQVEFFAELRISERGALLRTNSALVRARDACGGATGRKALYELRRNLRACLDRSLDRDTASLCASVLLGVPGAVDRRTRDLFQSTGTAHLLAISGLHVGIVLSCLSRLLRCAAVDGFAGTAARAAALVFICLATGGRTPVLRASAAAGLYLVSAACGRATVPAVLLFDAAFLILAFDPGAAAEISFQMSFAGCAAILVYLGWRGAVRSSLSRRIGRCADAAGIALCAWAGTAPLAAFYFGQVCWMAPLVNLAAVPVFGLVVSAGYGHLFLAWTAPPLAEITAPAVEALVRLLLAVLAAAAEHLPAPAVVAPPPGALLCAFYVLLACGLILAPQRRRGGALPPRRQEQNRRARAALRRNP